MFDAVGDCGCGGKGFRSQRAYRRASSPRAILLLNAKRPVLWNSPPASQFASSASAVEVLDVNAMKRLEWGAARRCPGLHAAWPDGDHALEWGKRGDHRSLIGKAFASTPEDFYQAGEAWRHEGRHGGELRRWIDA